MIITITNFIKANRGFIIFISLMLVFRSALADWSDVPTGSMQPTIVEGDRIFINKIAYDLRLPFSHISLAKLSDPKAGDIVIFDSNVTKMRLVKRVVGIPGDTVAMRDNTLIINDQPLHYQLEQQQPHSAILTEYLNNKAHSIKIAAQGSALSNFSSGRIPAGYYLVLGDNRDNSSDSRVIGLIPRQQIVGRSTRVAFSLDYENYYLPRQERFFHSL